MQRDQRVCRYAPVACGEVETDTVTAIEQASRRERTQSRMILMTCLAQWEFGGQATGSSGAFSHSEAATPG